MLMERPAKVATPADTVTAEPPVSVPAPGLFPMARVTVVVLLPVSTLPLASSTATVTAGEMAEPACALLGPWMNTRLFAAPGVTVKADEVAVVNDGVLDAANV